MCITIPVVDYSSSLSCVSPAGIRANQTVIFIVMLTAAILNYFVTTNTFGRSSALGL